jgi:hypothetical protein
MVDCGVDMPSAVRLTRDAQQQAPASLPATTMVTDARPTCAQTVGFGASGRTEHALQDHGSAATRLGKQPLLA